MKILCCILIFLLFPFFVFSQSYMSAGFNYGKVEISTLNRIFDEFNLADILYPDMSYFNHPYGVYFGYGNKLKKIKTEFCWSSKWQVVNGYNLDSNLLEYESSLKFRLNSLSANIGFNILDDDKICLYTGFSIQLGVLRYYYINRNIYIPNGERKGFLLLSNYISGGIGPDLELEILPFKENRLLLFSPPTKRL